MKVKRIWKYFRVPCDTYLNYLFIYQLAQLLRGDTFNWSVLSYLEITPWYYPWWSVISYHCFPYIVWTISGMDFIQRHRTLKISFQRVCLAVKCSVIFI